jgi:hypothetical protein
MEHVIAVLHDIVTDLTLLPATRHRLRLLPIVFPQQPQLSTALLLLSQGKIPDFYMALDGTEWPEPLQDLLKKLRFLVSEQEFLLFQQSYTSLSPQKAKEGLGLRTMEETIEYCLKQGWTLDGEWFIPKSIVAMEPPASINDIEQIMKHFSAINP